MQGKVCSSIIDRGSFVNISSLDMVTKLNLRAMAPRSVQHLMD